MIQIIGLMVAGYVVLRCLEIWAVGAGHWNTPRLGFLVRIWAGITCLGTIILTVSLYFGTEKLMGWIRAALHSPNTIDAGFGVAGLCLIGYGWNKSKRVYMKRAIAKLHRKTVLEGIDLSRSLM